MMNNDEMAGMLLQGPDTSSKKKGGKGKGDKGKADGQTDTCGCVIF